MEISKQTTDQLHLREENSMLGLIPLAIGLAGLILTMGMMKEYGMQAWYRMPYWLGGVIAVIGIFFWLFIPKSGKARFDKRKEAVNIELKRGLRTVGYQTYPLQEVQAVRLEEATFRKKDQEETRYRLAMQLFDEWVPVLPEFRPDLYAHQQAASSLIGFLGLEEKE